MNRRDIKHNARMIIKDAIESASWEETESIDSDEPYLSQYLGTVFSIMPSGKYYTPWANSNVDSCNHCKGSGLGKSIPCCICKGSGKRIKEPYMNFPEYTDGQEFICNACQGSGMRHDSCSYCGGLGSREAYEDSIMQDELEHYASKYGAWIESGEGDSSDLFICKSNSI